MADHILIGQQTEKRLDRVTKRADEARFTIREARERVEPPKITAKLGEISSEIYNRHPHDQTESSLFALPGELQIMIFRDLETDADKVAFALSCKKGARVFEVVKATYPKEIRRRKPTITRRLLVLIRLTRWMPQETYRLCFKCLRFRLKVKTDDAGGIRGTWGGNTEIITAAKKLDQEDPHRLKTKLRSFKTGGPWCPACKDRADFTSLRDQKKLKHLRSLIKRY